MPPLRRPWCGRDVAVDGPSNRVSSERQSHWTDSPPIFLLGRGGRRKFILFILWGQFIINYKFPPTATHTLKTWIRFEHPQDVILPVRWHSLIYRKILSNPCRHLSYSLLLSRILEHLPQEVEPAFRGHLVCLVNRGLRWTCRERFERFSLDGDRRHNLQVRFPMHFPYLLDVVVIVDDNLCHFSRWRWWLMMRIRHLGVFLHPPLCRNWVDVNTFFGVFLLLISAGSVVLLRPRFVVIIFILLLALLNLELLVFTCQTYALLLFPFCRGDESYALQVLWCTGVDIRP